ncbi:hypothetical protein ACPCA8_14730 [Streptomyces capoamus]|uniref:hypothetical protein n=1 Tax=Streptomyces capoamus TaxID=68183 RepID=UPI003C2BF1A4
MKDTFDALTFAGRLLGILVMTAGLVEVAAAMAAFEFWGQRRLRHAGVTVLIGISIVAVADIVFLVLQIQNRYLNPLLLLWGSLALWTVWAMRALTRQNIWATIPHPKGVALGVVVSAAIGATSIAYSQVYLPYSTPVRPDLSVSFGQPNLSTDGTYIRLPAHLEIRNESSVGVYVIGSLWTVAGEPDTFNPRGTEMNEYMDGLSQGSLGVYGHNRFGLVQLLSTAGVVVAPEEIPPGGKVMRDQLVDVPLKTGLSNIRVFAQLEVLRGDRYRPGRAHTETSWDPHSHRHIKDAPAWAARPGDEFIHHYFKIYRSSEILNLTHATDYASEWWILPHWRNGDGFEKDETDPQIATSITRDRGGNEPAFAPGEGKNAAIGLAAEAEQSVAQLVKEAKK